jgi:hypothetical protein
MKGCTKGPRKNNLAFSMPHKSWAVIDRPYCLSDAAVGAFYDRPDEMPGYFCAIPKVATPAGLAYPDEH